MQAHQPFCTCMYMYMCTVLKMLVKSEALERNFCTRKFVCATELYSSLMSIRCFEVSLVPGSAR